MNTSTLINPSSFVLEDFAAGVLKTARSVMIGSPSNSTRRAERFFPFSIAPLGLAESVNRIVVGQSIDLPPLLRQRVGELSDLAPNWDGENAKPIRGPVLGDIVEMLRRLSFKVKNFHSPFLAPTFDGYVQMEWHDTKRSLEIEAIAEGWSVVGIVKCANGKREYQTSGFARSDFNRLEKAYDWFAGDELLWPSQ